MLEAGADPNALCTLYGSLCTTMALLVSSSPPASAGVQVPVLNLLIDHGAWVAPRGEGNWTSPLITALVFGFKDAAPTLVDRGAPIDTLAAAAGLGRIEDVTQMLPSATPDDRHRALALASQLGHSDIVTLLLDAGEDRIATTRPARTRIHRRCIRRLPRVTLLWSRCWSSAARAST